MIESPTKRYGLTTLATALGCYALLGGFTSLVGWPLDIPRLTDWFNNDVSIQPNTCVLMMLSGAALVLVPWGAMRAVTALGAVVGLGGALILLQYIVGADFGFNHQLLFGRTWGQGTTLTPGRVGPPASTSFTLTGTALLLLAWSGLRPGSAFLRRFVPMLGVAVCVIMAFSLLGYLFEAEQFYTIPWLTAIALQTATMLLAVGIGLILSVPEHQPMLLLREHSGAGALARIAIPALVVMIPLVLWLRIGGYEQAYYDLGTGRALGALTLVVSTVAILWIALMALRRHEQALRDADRRKDEFLATLAHELRNPLAPVMSSLAILDQSGSDQAVAIEAREIMWRQLKHLVRLVDDLLDVSRITRGKIELRKERMELRAAVEQAIETVRPMCEALAHEVVVELPPRPVWLDADPARMAQVLGNLLSNACRYSGRGTPIHLRALREGADVVVSVIDNGIGIEPDKLESIFGMFSQIDSSRERNTGGLGIGLYLVKRLVELHGGTITAHSDGLGKGSRFVVRLPVATKPVQGALPGPTDHPEDSWPLSARRRILIVDDNHDAAQSLAVLLNVDDHVTRIARDGPQALQCAQRFNPDVILLDIGLPKLNGYEVCRQIREQPCGRQMIIIAVTGWGQEEDKRRAQESGFDAHLVKPVQPAQLREVLATLPQSMGQQQEPVISGL